MKIFDYSDVILIPQKGIVNSRNECDTSVKLGNFTFKIPVVPANMESVIDENLCIKLAENGYFYIMHRFGIDNKAFIKKMKSLGLFTSISIGVNEDSYDLIADLVHEDLMPDFITIDIAHGHSIKMENMIKFIKTFGSNSFIICGNICTKEAVIDLTEWGADCLKVGIAPGEVCFIDGTKILTKYGYQNIEDINLGDLVMTSEMSWGEVINKVSYLSDENLIEINGDVCTEDHEFYVINKSNIGKADNNNYKDFCFFLKAKDIDPKIHKIVSIEM